MNLGEAASKCCRGPVSPNASLGGRGSAPKQRANALAVIRRRREWDMTMEDDLLKKFISLVGPALEEEGRILLGRTYIRGKPRGILNLIDERYYQRICWKAAMTRWDAHIEKGTYGLSLHSPDNEKEPFAVFERSATQVRPENRRFPRLKKTLKVSRRQRKALSNSPTVVRFSYRPVEVERFQTLDDGESVSLAGPARKPERKASE